jgi:hypothetical protein
MHRCSGMTHDLFLLHLCARSLSLHPHESRPLFDSFSIPFSWPTAVTLYWLMPAHARNSAFAAAPLAPLLTSPCHLIVWIPCDNFCHLFVEIYWLCFYVFTTERSASLLAEFRM